DLTVATDERSEPGGVGRLDPVVCRTLAHNPIEFHLRTRPKRNLAHQLAVEIPTNQAACGGCQNDVSRRTERVEPPEIDDLSHDPGPPGDFSNDCRAGVDRRPDRAAGLAHKR